jgi:hypothetical protein
MEIVRECNCSFERFGFSLTEIYPLSESECPLESPPFSRGENGDGCSVMHGERANDFLP